MRNRLDELQNLARVWVAGGDGTLSRIAPVLIDRQMILGILPLGTGNSLARELGVPLRLDEAMEFHLSKSEPKSIDVGEIDGRPFLNAVSIGVTTGIAGALKSLPKHRFGNWVYLPGVIKAVRTARPFTMTIHADAAHFEGNVLQFVAASTRNHGGKFAVSPVASINDGLLSVYAVQPERRTTLLRYAVGLVVGRQTHLGEVWNCESSGVNINLLRARRFVADGDLLPKRIQTVLTIRPGALCVLG